MVTTIQVVFDCAAPAELGRFWAAALGYVEQPPPEGFPTWEEFLQTAGVPESEWDSAYALVDPDGREPRVYFQKVPEPKLSKNRLHLDLNVGGGPQAPLEERKRAVEAEARRLAELGADIVGRVEERGEFHIGMLDPEGNEFDIQ
jgi:hypothetical protein